VCNALTTSSKEGGVALIAVLWLVSLLTLLATAVVTLSVTQRRTVQRYVETVQADMTEDSAIRVALLQLINPPERAVAAPIGTQTLKILDSSVDVTLELEAGRIDLNTADPDLLVALFAANGWTERAARSMVARIQDWRDPDDETREQGAESREYRAAGLSYEPRNANFESVDELRQVLGSEAISEELLDSLTVYAHSTGCVESIAKAAAKRALTWADERQLGGHRWLPENATATGSAAPASFATRSLAGEVIRVRACMSTGSGAASRCRGLVARITGKASTPLEVFEWRAVPTIGP
jgi:general secretion pathway protein K